MSYHVPVMLKECIDALGIKPDGVYVDVTFGGGGHSKEILKQLKGGKLYGFDQDPDAVQNTKDLDPRSFTLIPANFRYLKKYLRLNGIQQIDGLLADLGVSSHQFDSAERGFSTRFEGKLDMRMDQSSDLDAAVVINEYSEEQLHRIFGMYGELTNAKTAANAVVKGRFKNKIETTQQLKDALRSCAPRGKENKYFAQLFQALRIEVNDELGALQEMLLQSAEVIKPGGKLVVMSYHSLEDRLVKNFIAKGKFFGEIEKDIYGNFSRPFEEIQKKPIEATEAEIEVNSRARSAKLRVGVRTQS